MCTQFIIYIPVESTGLLTPLAFFSEEGRIPFLIQTYYIKTYISTKTLTLHSLCIHFVHIHLITMYTIVYSIYRTLLQ